MAQPCRLPRRDDEPDYGGFRGGAKGGYAREAKAGDGSCRPTPALQSLLQIQLFLFCAFAALPHLSFLPVRCQVNYNAKTLKMCTNLQLCACAVILAALLPPCLSAATCLGTQMTCGRALLQPHPAPTARVETAAELHSKPPQRASADNPRLWKRVRKRLARILCTAACEWGAFAVGRGGQSRPSKADERGYRARNNSYSRPCGRGLSAFPRTDHLRHAAESDMRVRQVLPA